MDLKLRLLQGWDTAQERFAALQARERLLVIAGAALVLLTLLYLLVVNPLQTATGERRARITAKQQDLAWMQSVAPQLSTLAAALPTPSSSSESMVVLIANSATNGNVSAALTGQTPDGPDGVRVRFEAVGFDALVVWLGALQRDYGIQITEAEINRLSQPGLVNASLGLSRNPGR